LSIPEAARLALVLFGWISGLALISGSATALAADRESTSRFGFSISGQLPTVAGAFAPVLTPQFGGTLAVDIPMPGFKGRTRLLALAGMQNYGIANSSLLTLSTYELGAGVAFHSDPYLWVIEPTLKLGAGATFGSLQIDGVRSETQNLATYPMSWVSPGIAGHIWEGLSLGLEMPVRVIFQRNLVITLSPALTLGYEL